MTDKLLNISQRLIKWDTDFPPNCWNGYAGLKELDAIIADAKVAVHEAGASYEDDFGQTPAPQPRAAEPLKLLDPADDKAIEWVTRNLMAIRRDSGEMHYSLGQVVRSYQAGSATAQEENERLRAAPPKHGIYIASKTKHADRWRFLRDKVGEPIISTWIDEAGAGESSDLADLWRRCISEASTAQVLILYREPNEVLKGGWIELGAALSSGVTVFAVGIEEFTVASDTRIQHFPTIKAAIKAARATLSTPSKEDKTDAE